MTISAATTLIDDGDAEVRQLPADVVGLVRSAAEASNHGLSWGLHLDTTDRRAPSLTLGIRGDQGFVSWWDGNRVVHSAGGNTEPVDYWTGGHHMQTDPHTEIPVEYVYAALGEFLATHQRPTCITWR